MFNKLISGMAAFCILFVAQPGSAQTGSTMRKDDAAQLPAALSALIKTAYICQGVVGADVLDQAKGLAHDELVKLGLDDFNATMLVTTSEGAAEQACDDADTCWRLLPGLNANSTETEGQTACNARLGDEIRLIQDLNKAVGL